ncbi:MAG: hypothetical protein IJR08_05195 [Bacilli bacterium]|nr:hypothetical protein [Bacilli bacterium]
MKIFKDFFKDRSLGFFIALAGGCLAIIVSVIYLVSYLSIYVDKMDRVFSILTFLCALLGGLVVLVGELLRIEYISMAGPVLLAVALAKHSVEAAYPIADMGTGVVFFGGNQLFAVLFIVLIGIVFLTVLVPTFLKHNKQ